MHGARVDGGVAEGLEVAVVVGPKALRQQGLQPFAEVALVHPEHLAGGGVDKFDTRLAADADDAVVGGVDHRLEALAAHLERLLQLLFGGDVDGGDHDAGDA